MSPPLSLTFGITLIWMVVFVMNRFRGDFEVKAAVNS